MKISDILAEGKRTLSFEVFPPKTIDKFDSVLSAAEEIAALKPSFMSVTYGAGGGTSAYTAEIASGLASFGVTPLAHLTCISSTRERVGEVLADLRALAQRCEYGLSLGDGRGEEREVFADEAYGLGSVQEQLKHRLTAIGAGAFVHSVLKAYASGVQSANGGKNLLAQLGVERASAVLHSHGAVAVVPRLEPCVRLLGAAVAKPHSRIQSAAEVFVTVQSQKTKVVCH